MVVGLSGFLVFLEEFFVGFISFKGFGVEMVIASRALSVFVFFFFVCVCVYECGGGVRV